MDEVLAGVQREVTQQPVDEGDRLAALADLKGFLKAVFTLRVVFTKVLAGVVSVLVFRAWDCWTIHMVFGVVLALVPCVFTQTEQKGMLLHNYSVSSSGSTKFPISVRVSQGVL